MSNIFSNFLKFLITNKILGISFSLLVIYFSVSFYYDNKNTDIINHKMYSIATIVKKTWTKPSLIYDFLDNKRIIRSSSVYESDVERFYVGQKFKVIFSSTSPDKSILLLHKPILPHSDSMVKSSATVNRIEKIYSGFLFNRKLKFLKVFYYFYYLDKKYLGIIYLLPDEIVEENSDYIIEFPKGKPQLGVFRVEKKINYDNLKGMEEKLLLKEKDSIKIIKPKIIVVGGDTIQVIDE